MAAGTRIAAVVDARAGREELPGVATCESHRDHRLAEFRAAFAVSDEVADDRLHHDEVFTLMRNGNAYFVDALAGLDGVRVTSLRHEAGTVAGIDPAGLLRP